jgi:hypothetical protein
MKQLVRLYCVKLCGSGALGTTSWINDHFPPMGDGGGTSLTMGIEMAQRGINLLQIILVTSLLQGLCSSDGDSKTPHLD